MTEVGTRNSLHVPSATHVNSHKIKVPCILQIVGQLVLPRNLHYVKLIFLIVNVYLSLKFKEVKKLSRQHQSNSQHQPTKI